MATRASISPPVRESTAERRGRSRSHRMGLTDPQARAPVRARLPEGSVAATQASGSAAHPSHAIFGRWSTTAAPPRSITAASTTTAPPAPSQAARPAVMSAPAGAGRRMRRPRLPSSATASRRRPPPAPRRSTVLRTRRRRAHRRRRGRATAGSAVETPTGAMLGHLDVIRVDARIRLAKEACRALPPGLLPVVRSRSVRERRACARSRRIAEAGCVAGVVWAPPPGLVQEPVVGIRVGRPCSSYADVSVPRIRSRPGSRLGALVA
jgi:hypothetical protein